jgi:hypothetical protein
MEKPNKDTIDSDIGISSSNGKAIGSDAISKKFAQGSGSLVWKENLPRVGIRSDAIVTNYSRSGF